MKNFAVSVCAVFVAIFWCNGCSVDTNPATGEEETWDLFETVSVDIVDFETQKETETVTIDLGDTVSVVVPFDPDTIVLPETFTHVDTATVGDTSTEEDTVEDTEIVDTEEGTCLCKCRCKCHGNHHCKKHCKDKCKKHCKKHCHHGDSCHHCKGKGKCD